MCTQWSRKGSGAFAKGIKIILTSLLNEKAKQRMRLKKSG